MGYVINNNLEQQAVAVFNKFYDASTNQQPFTTLINVLGGGTPKTGNPEFWDGSIPFFTPKDVGTPYTFKTEKYITELGLKHCNSRLYPTNKSYAAAMQSWHCLLEVYHISNGHLLLTDLHPS